jgi:hypothetical protein
MSHTKLITWTLVAAVGCGRSSTQETTTPSSSASVEASPAAEIVLDQEHIELSMERSIARQQALEQARATGTKKENGDERLPEPPPGPRTKESIRAAFVESRMNAIKRCYEAAIYADQSAQGSVEITFQIIDNGNVASPSASGFTDAIHACLVGEVLKTRFPTGGVTPVRWTLKFSST